MEKRHIIAILLKNAPGAMSRVVGLFAARGYNIESIAAGVTEAPGLSRMTIVSRSDDATKEQIMKQLNRLIEVVRVTDLTDNEYVEREMLLVKVRAQRGDRDSLAGLAELFRGRIVDVAEKSCTVELTLRSLPEDRRLPACA